MNLSIFGVSIFFTITCFLKGIPVRTQFFGHNFHPAHNPNIIFPDVMNMRPGSLQSSSYRRTSPSPFSSTYTPSGFHFYPQYPYYGYVPQNSPNDNYHNGFNSNIHFRPNYRRKSHNHHRPRRPSSNYFQNFVGVFNEIDGKAEKNYNATAEATELHDDFHGRSMVAPGQYPHMAALGYETNSPQVEFKCGGSLISEYFVLTAAHCCVLNGNSPVVVKFGDINLMEREQNLIPQRRRIAEIYVHPNYNSSYYYHDIALIQLNRPIGYTPFVRPIRLWARDEIPYDKVFTMGYGSTSFAHAPTNILTELDLSIVASDVCNNTLPQDENAPKGIVETQICAKDYEKNRDTCQGDSGGPLQLNLQRRRRRRLRYYLVGIISYGTYCRSPYPGVYTRVSSYVDWIASIVWPDYFQNF